MEELEEDKMPQRGYMKLDRPGGFVSTNRYTYWFGNNKAGDFFYYMEIGDWSKEITEVSWKHPLTVERELVDAYDREVHQAAEKQKSLDYINCKSS